MDVSQAFDLSGRTALVTGSSRGIGHALARGLAGAGATVITHGRSAQAGAETRFPYYAADLADADACRRLAHEVLAEHARVDILVLNAAADLRLPWLETTAAQADHLLAANFRSSLLLCQALMPLMAARGWGRIIAIGSIQEVHPNPSYLVYAAAKAAQTSLVHNLARQVGTSGVTVNNLAPGAIATDRNAGPLADASYRERVEAMIPAGRVGTPKDCVGACLLLASDAGAYINGTSLFVDGGWSA